MNSTFETLYRKIFAANGLENYISDRIETALERLTDKMLEVNAHMNLTAITDIEEIIAKHYADSLLVADRLPQHAKVVDVGCGAGFPSLPLAIARPDLAVTALDSTGKRIAYVADCAAMLGLDNLTAVTARAEDAAAVGKPDREAYDVVVSRAVAALPVLSELCLPFARVGGMVVAMKAQRATEELSAAGRGIAKLGGRVLRVDARSLTLREAEEERNLIFVEKIGKTPIIYPRNFAQIKKKPL